VREPPSVAQLLSAAVAALGGVERPGQVRMAEAVAEAMRAQEHLLVQAGTGTGKSLGYLVPALLHGKTVVVATATLALQAQLIERDLPRLVEVARPLLGFEPTYAILKGRGNYVCRQRLHAEDMEGGEALFEYEPSSRLGREVQRARSWAEQTPTGDRDELIPGVSDRAWAQLSVSARECLGAARCPFGATCFAELARGRAGAAKVVVTNHALLAIDALDSLPVLPEHDIVIVDEAHDLVDRVTGVATAELSPSMIERAGRRSARVAEQRPVEVVLGIGESLGALLTDIAPGRLDPMPPRLAAELAAVRDATRSVLASISTSWEDGAEELAVKRRARAAVEEVADVATRLVQASPHDVAWLADEERRDRVLRVAPLSVSGLLRSTLFRDRTVVLTSATLQLGGTFDALARGVGLIDAGPGLGADAGKDVGKDVENDVENDVGADVADDPPAWRGLDVGSPFDYAGQGILYVARHLPPPGRDGLSGAVLDELTDLVTAAGGRALGLFSSRRAAEQAAAELRSRVDMPVLCQGEGTLAELVRRFAAEPTTCLFGTLSLWQGVDIPGPACQLVVVDRIPFPRPDDPLLAARAKAVDEAGGSGFMTVSASHAALRLAQGAGRLVRTMADRGVVAVLDSRLATARYAGFLRRSLPPFWYTTDPAVVRAALARIDAVASHPSDAA
jgi:ATP-dependent DNA helicase DinG